MTDRNEWRPLEAKSMARAPAIKDPIIEPLWQGTRVLAHFHAAAEDGGSATVRMVDTDGYDVSDEFAAVTSALERAVMAREAVIDGVLTDQALAGGLGVGIVPGAEVSPMGMLLGRASDVTVEPSRDREHGDEIAFVALDLLSVDDESLVELPLLERKRQLEGVFAASELARISPYVRPPLADWFNSWKSAGFRGVVMKASNSRYRQADIEREWAIVERMSPR